MEDKRQVKVVIDGKKFTVVGNEEETYLKKVADYVNNRLEEIKKMDGFKRLNRDYQLLTIYLNLADDYFKLKQGDVSGAQIEKLENQIHQLTYELVDAGLEKESLEKEKTTLAFELEKLNSFVDELEKEKKELEEQKQELAERVKTFDTKFRELEQELKEKEQSLSDSEDEQLRLMEENEQLKKELEKLQVRDYTA